MITSGGGQTRQQRNRHVQALSRQVAHLWQTYVDLNGGKLTDVHNGGGLAAKHTGVPLIVPNGIAGLPEHLPNLVGFLQTLNGNVP